MEIKMNNSEQQLAFDLYLKGDSFFLTGGAGTGKSFVLKSIISNLRQTQEPDRIGITSLTGVSAIPLNGRTLHSWTGIGLGDQPVNSLISKIKRNQEAHSRWLRCRVLIIDEISMMNTELFEKLDQIGCQLRMNTSKLFGGIQVILAGDFLQLPPIVGAHCFTSPIWKKYVTNTVYLFRIIRQENTIFRALLSRMRLGQVSLDDQKLLNSRKIPFNNKSETNLIKPTCLYPFKKNVDEINTLELKKLISNGCKQFVSYPQYSIVATKQKMAPHSREMNDFNNYQREFGLAAKRPQLFETISGANYNSVLEFSIGSQVMLTYNLDVDRGLVNGSRGVVCAIGANSNPIVRFQVHNKNTNQVVIVDEDVEISRQTYEIDHYYYLIKIQQYPLILAWALTIHKVQSATLNCVETDLSQVFSAGQSYVCLSRVQDLDNLYLLGINFSKIRADKSAIEFYQNLGVVCVARLNQLCTPDQVNLKNISRICQPCLRTFLSRSSLLCRYQIELILFYM